MGTPPQPPPPQQPGYGAPQQQGNPGIAVAGFVVGLIGLLISWLFIIGLVVCAVGLVLSIMGRKAAVERGAPTGLATAGLVCSIVGLVIAVIISIVVGVLLDDADDALDELNEELESSTTFEINVVVGLWLLRDRVMAPIKRLKS